MWTTINYNMFRFRGNVFTAEEVIRLTKSIVEKKTGVALEVKETSKIDEKKGITEEIAREDVTRSQVVQQSHAKVNHTARKESMIELKPAAAR